jgi:serine/threonine protein kinase/tetratricopeptide (TPR) repeat protein
MNTPESTPLEEQLTPLLVACDKALAAGESLPNASEAQTAPELQSGLEQGLACIQLLRQVLPRRRALASAGLPYHHLGRFEIRRELGRGAFGMVFLAYDPQLGRDVALKVPRPEALVTADLRQRFVREARAAAGLDHPNLVPVYEAGEVGPVCYIASAYCPGTTLAEWLKERGEPVPVRTAALLVATLAAAVQHAHSRGVVHRDLKPSNVLLQLRPESKTSSPDSTLKEPGTAPGPSGSELGFVPKVTDFGLAKLTPATPVGAGEESGGSTQSGPILGTPSYMAPEQARGRNKGVGPAADVYALGAILYELLVGRPPFRGETALETLEQVRSHEPVPPRRLRPKLARDLETICLKCLEKEPGKRYPTAEALANDLGSFLAGTPIQARPVGQGERLWRWCCRNPVIAALTASAALFLLAGTGISSYFAVQANHRAQEALGEKNRADDNAARTQEALTAEGKRRQQTRDALDMLSSQIIDEWLARQKTLLPEHRRFLEKALASYEELARDTGQEEASRAGVARAYWRVGNIRQRLGQTAQAEVAYRRCRDLFQQLADEFPAVAAYRQDLGRSYNNLGVLLKNTGRVPEAEQAYRDALKFQEQLVDEFPNVAEYRQALATDHNNLGILLLTTGRVQDAEGAYRDALKLRQQLVTDFPSVSEHRQSLAVSHHNLGVLLENTGRVQDAEQAYRDAVKLQEQVAADFPNVPEYRKGLAASHMNLGNLLMNTGRLPDAERAYRDALKLRQQLADDFPNVPEYRQSLAASYNNLANLLKIAGRVPDAERAYGDALKLQQQLATEFPDVPEYRHDLAIAHNNLARLLESTGRVQDAEHAHRDALKLRQQLAADSPNVPKYRRDLAASHNSLGNLLRSTGRVQDAEQAYGAALKLQQQLAAEFPNMPEYRQHLAGTYYNLGNLWKTDRAQDAEGAYRDALKLRQQLADDFPNVTEYRQSLAASFKGLGNLLATTGRAADAERALRDALKLGQQLADDFPNVPEYRQHLAQSHANLGLLLESTGRVQDAERANSDGLKLYQQLVADFPNVSDYQNELANTLGILAKLLFSRKEFGAARQRLEQAVSHHQAALKANPRHPIYRQFFFNNQQLLAQLLLELGEHAAAADAAAQVAQAAFDPANDIYIAAAFLSRCVPLAEQDPQLSETQRKQVAQTYADRALATLRQAVQNGYKDVPHLKKDQDLDPLRDREDFKKLLAELEEKAKAGGQ